MSLPYLTCVSWDKSQGQLRFRACGMNSHCKGCESFSGLIWWTPWVLGGPHLLSIKLLSVFLPKSFSAQFPQRRWLILRLLESEDVLYQSWKPAFSGVVCVCVCEQGEHGNPVTQPMRLGELRSQQMHASPFSSVPDYAEHAVPHSQSGRCPRWLSNWLIFPGSHGQRGKVRPALCASLPLFSLIPSLVAPRKTCHATLDWALLSRKPELR